MNIEKLRELRELLDEGILSQEEFDAQKAIILASDTESSAPPSPKPSKADKAADPDEKELKEVRELASAARGISAEEYSNENDKIEALAEFWKYAFMPERPAALAEAARNALLGAEPTLFYFGNHHIAKDCVALLNRAESLIDRLAHHSESDPSLVASLESQLEEKRARHQELKTEAESKNAQEKKWMIGIFVILALLVGGIIAFSDGSSKDGAEEDSVPAYIQIRDQACEEYNEAGNDIQRSRIYNEVKEKLKSYTEVKNLHGEIKAIETPSSGSNFAVVKIMVDDHEFDNVYGLLDGFKYVDKGTTVWDQISNLNEGDDVVFSGNELEFSGNPFSEKLSVCKLRWNVHYTDIRKR